jgi:hypothetical protein
MAIGRLILSLFEQSSSECCVLRIGDGLDVSRNLISVRPSFCVATKPLI